MNSLNGVSASAAQPSGTAVGIFDSGIGGLSILQHIAARLPQQDLLYFADTGFAPYGEKPEAVIVERSLHIAQFLLSKGAKALVVACNTATVAAIKVLRGHYPQLPLVGVEPGLKPAALASQAKIVGVLATNRTLQGEKFARLQQEISEQHQVQFLLQGCTGLARQIDRGELTTPATLDLLTRYVTPLLEQGADTLVLGCTHYPFVRPQIEHLIRQHQNSATTSNESGAPPITLIDTGDAVARQLQRLLQAHHSGTPGNGTQLKEALPRGTHQNGAIPGERTASTRTASNAEITPALLPAKTGASLHAYTSGPGAELQLAFSQLLNLSPPVEQIGHF